MIKRGKNPEKFSKLLNLLLSNEELPAKYRNHKLLGCYKGSQELHIEPDWLLVYKLTKGELILERTGTHCDLFK